MGSFPKLRRGLPPGSIIVGRVTLGDGPDSLNLVGGVGKFQTPMRALVGGGAPSTGTCVSVVEDSLGNDAGPELQRVRDPG